MSVDRPLITNPSELRALIIAPTTADANAMARLLNLASISCEFFTSMVELCDAVGGGAGLLIVSEEALIAEVDRLAACIEEQPVWSDLPILVLSRAGAESVQFGSALQRIGNASVVERPVRVTTLISLIRTALRARQRQYEVRGRLVERERLLESERQARTEAERAGRMKDEFLATLSHELRTPLNAMLGWSQLLRNTPGLPDEVADGLSVIERNARSQTEIIEDLLDMSRIISGKVHLEIQHLDLVAILESAIATVRPAAEARGVAVELVTIHDTCVIPADASRVQQIFWNLLTNAVKFTPKDGRVSVSLEADSAKVRVTVADTGQGIDAAFLPYVFDRFRQADASTTRKHGGLGLGLSIVKQLVELHGGTITAASDGAQRGSVFTVVLPLAGRDCHAEETASGERPAVHEARGPAAQSAGELRHIRVMVVDDEDDARLLLRRVLENAGAQVITAASVREAIEAMERELPDVLISDIGMPDEDGYSLIRRIRSLVAGDGAALPAVALTAYARSEDRQAAMTAGFHAHLAKPVETTELIAVINRLLPVTERLPE